MEFVILGLLLMKDMTGYEISRFIKNNFAMICSNSAGSVQNALKKLVNSEFIDFEEVVENGKNKKIFSITENGKSEFLNWVKNPMQTSKIKNMELSKLFFLGFAKKCEQKKSIENYIEQLKSVRKALYAIKEEFTKIVKEQLTQKSFNNDQSILNFQQYTLEYGIDSAEFEIDWYTKLLEKLEK